VCLFHFQDAKIEIEAIAVVGEIVDSTSWLAKGKLWGVRYKQNLSVLGHICNLNKWQSKM
jgi:hypothetical protein